MAANEYQTPRTAFELLLGTTSLHFPSEVSKQQAKLLLNQEIHSVKFRYAVTKVQGQTSTWFLSHLVLKKQENCGLVPWLESVIF